MEEEAPMDFVDENEVNPINPDTLDTSIVAINLQDIAPLNIQPDLSADGSPADDFCKFTDKIAFSIEHFTAPATVRKTANYKSDSVSIFGLSWKMSIGLKIKYLGFKIQCEPKNEYKNSRWSCTASVKFRILSQKEDKEDIVKVLDLYFLQNSNEQGDQQFAILEELIDENNGYIENDTVRFEVEIVADPPRGTGWDSKLQTNCVGLVNQGTTCYINSILQVMFFTNKLRRAIYNMQLENEGTISTLQQLFYQLQFFDKAVSTKNFTKTLGWWENELSGQHDVHEFCRNLFDGIEQKMRSTSADETVSDLFKGQMLTSISCLNVDCKSVRLEEFYDLQLKVKGMPDVYASLGEYENVELLDGDNMYDAGAYGKQQAVKSVSFVEFPPVLHLHLMRFEFDLESNKAVKIDDRYEFPSVLNLDRFIDKQNGIDDDYTYLLQAILIHSGNSERGHYIAFINTTLGADEPKWCRFNDDVVSRCTEGEALERSFGETGTSFWSKGSAYMLVYVQQNKLDKILCDVTRDNIPAELIVKVEEMQRTIEETKKVAAELKKQDAKKAKDERGASKLVRSDTAPKSRPMNNWQKRRG